MAVKSKVLDTWFIVTARPIDRSRYPSSRPVRAYSSLLLEELLSYRVITSDNNRSSKSFGKDGVDDTLEDKFGKGEGVRRWPLVLVDDVPLAPADAADENAILQLLLPNVWLNEDLRPEDEPRDHTRRLSACSRMR